MPAQNIAGGKTASRDDERFLGHAGRLLNVDASLLAGTTTPSGRTYRTSASISRPVFHFTFWLISRITVRISRAEASPMFTIKLA